MPVTIKIATHGASATHIGRSYFAKSSQDIHDRGLRRGARHSGKSILQSSFSKQTCKEHNLVGSPNGFVFAAIEAYNRHHHLTIRPDDIWFAILSQFKCWLNRHAEEVRKMFVSHEDKKELKIVYANATRFDIDIGDFAKEMTRLIEENIIDPDLREWMMPAFTTTTDKDHVIASVFMMGALQPFFAYTAETLCGIPSVTLTGDKFDWERLLSKLAKLATFGEEPAKFGELLKPVVSRFVQCFERPVREDVIDFWKLIVSETHAESGQSCYNGWIAAFCFWDGDGNNLHHKADPDDINFYSDCRLSPFESNNNPPARRSSELRENLELDGVTYHPVDSTDVPPGFASVPVRLVDNGYDGKIFETSLVAGIVGMRYAASGDGGGNGLDSLQPVSGWWMFIDREG